MKKGRTAKKTKGIGPRAQLAADAKKLEIITAKLYQLAKLMYQSVQMFVVMRF